MDRRVWGAALSRGRGIVSCRTQSSHALSTYVTGVIIVVMGVDGGVKATRCVLFTLDVDVRNLRQQTICRHKFRASL